MMPVEELLRLIEANGRRVWTAGSQSESAVASLEGRLGHRLPPSYRDFLLRFGSVSIVDSGVSGIYDGDPFLKECGSTYGDTLRFREDHGLPTQLLVIQPDEDAPYCLDSSQPDKWGEFPVVCYELHSGHTTKIADNFESWLRNWFLRP